MSAGAALRAAREQAGLTTQQIGDRIKIQPQKIEDLENGHFDNLPHGIYLDGIVRAYAKEVSVDPEPLVQRVRDDQVRVIHNLYAAPDGLDAFLSEDPAPAAPSKPAEPTVIAPPVEVASPPAIAAPAPAVTPAPAPPAKIEPTREQIKPQVEAQATPTIPPARVLSTPDWNVIEPLRQRVSPLDTVAVHPYVPPESPASAENVRRLGLLALTLSLVAAIGWLGFLYQRTAPPAHDTTRGIEPTESQTAPLSSGGNASAVTRETSRAADTTPTAQRPTRDAAPTPTPRSRPATPANAATGPAPPTNSIGTTGSVPNVSGPWTLATQLDSTSYARFSGLQLGYTIQLTQAGDRVTGVGRKVSENGGGIRPRAQTPISVAGTIEGDRLTLAFTERGARRPTQGKFVLLLEEDGAMRGRFSSSAARSSGTVEARRVQ